MLAIQKPLTEVTELDVRGWMADEMQKVEPSTLNNRCAVLRSFYNFLEFDEIIQKNPMKKIRPIKTEQKVRTALTPVEISALRDHCETPRERAELELFLSSGVRVGEVLNADRNDINLVTGEVLVRKGKGNKQRITYINDVCVEYLKKYLITRTDDNPCLFYSRNHHRVCENTYRNDLNRIAERTNMNIHLYPHRCRRTMATELHHKNVDLATIQKLLGHSDISTTMIYIQQDQESIKNEYMYKNR